MHGPLTRSSCSISRGPSAATRDFFFSVVTDFSRKCFVPLCVGGGVREVDDFKRYLDLGADKISINTAAIEQPDLITQAAQRFGSQCVVVSIDVRKEADGYRVYKNCGRERDGMAARGSREARRRARCRGDPAHVHRSGRVAGRV